MRNYIRKCFFLILLSFCGVSSGLTDLEEIVMKDNVRNFYKVSDGIYRSAQPDKASMELLYTAGVKTILNLRKYHSDEYEAKNTRLNLERIKIDAGKIKDEDIIEALKILGNSEKPILIHCWHGSDRTGVVVAMYRIIYEGASKEDAIKELRDSKYGYHEFIYGNIVKYINNADIEKLKAKIL